MGHVNAGAMRLRTHSGGASGRQKSSGVGRELLEALSDERTKVVDARERCTIGISAREHFVGRRSGGWLPILRH